MITSFGDNGRLNMRLGDLRPLGGPSGTAGRVFENLFLTGSVVGETYGSPPGDLRAFDVITGKLVWTFHTIPHPGEFGYDTWPEGAYKWAGGVNTWGEISIDKARAIAYFPLGSPTHDSYGGDRPGNNLFGNSLVALDGLAGQRGAAVAIVPATIFSATRSSRSMHAPANACGTSRRCITIHGTTT